MLTRLASATLDGGRRVFSAAQDRSPKLHRLNLERRVRARLEAEPELRVCEALVALSGGFVDIGANEGLYSVTAAKNLGSSGDIVSFEPIPHLARRLQQAIPESDIRAMALSSETSTMELFIPTINGSRYYSRASLVSQGAHASAEMVIQVQVEKLDDQPNLPTRPLIKIDVEGAELDVLDGGERYLTSSFGVLVESEERHMTGAPRRIIDWFSEREFRGWMILGSTMISVEQFHLPTHQSDAAIATLNAGGAAPAGYGNNFLFVHSNGVKDAVAVLESAGFQIDP